MNLRTPVAVTLLFLSGCITTSPDSLKELELATQRAQQSLISGIRLYEDGNYADAERQLQRALESHQTPIKDRVSALKYLGFIYCSQQKMAECTESFNDALELDPKFELTPKEAGHPMWGPLFKSLKASAAGKKK